MADLLNVHDLSVNYQVRRFSKLALDSVSLDIPSSGYSLGIVGESGSGKTTLGMSIMNLIEAPGKITGGSIQYREKDILDMSRSELRKYRWEEVSMIYQSAMNSLSPVKNVSGHIVEVIKEHTGASKREAREQALKLLAQVGIEDRADGFPHELSGGMRQRAIIAMALVLSPKLLIADEPSSALDVVVQRQILALIKDQIKKRGLSLLFITHDIAILGGLVEHIAVMYQGEIVERGPLDKVVVEPMHPYTEMLLSSTLTLESDREVLNSTSQESRLLAPRQGCRFANRCKYAFDRCRTEKPKLLETESGRLVACHKFN
jgi:peptide/nickel transport system ATP-binding protein